MRRRGSKAKSARTREQLAQLYERLTAAESRPTRNRLAWKLVRLIVDPCASFDSLCCAVRRALFHEPDQLGWLQEVGLEDALGGGLRRQTGSNQE